MSFDPKTPEPFRPAEARSLLAAIPDPICYIDHSFSYRYVNSAYAKRFERKPDELLAKKIWEFEGPGAFALSKNALERALAGEAQRFEAKLPYLSEGQSTEKWVAVQCVPALADDQQIHGAFCYVREIAATKEVLQPVSEKNALQLALERARTSEESFRVTFENSPVGIIKVDPELRFLSVSPAFAKLVGYSVAELMTLSIFDLTHHDDLPISKKVATQMRLNEGRQELFYKRYVTKSGGTVWVRVTSQHVQAPNPKDSVYISAVEDVTEIRKIEEELEKQRSLISSVLSNLPNMVFAKDYQSDLRFTVFNKAGEELLGVEAKNLLGKTDYDLFPKEQADAFTQKDREVFLNGGTVKIDQEPIETPRGQRLLRTYKVPTYKSDGSPDLLIGISSDITDEVRMQKTLDLEKAKSSHHAKLASLGEMSAGIAHEINNPLAVIVGNLRLLKRDGLDSEKFLARCETISKSADRITKIIRSLQKFSRSTTGSEHKLEKLSSIIHEALAITEAKAKRHSVSVKVSLESESALLCDSVEIEQVLINMINNGIDAVKDLDPKWIELHGFEEGSELVLQVVDSGLGIPEEIEEKLFEPFFTTKSVGEGTGLGLSVSKGILDQHKAKVTLNRAFKHTCFEIRFPLARIQVSDAA